MNDAVVISSSPRLVEGLKALSRLAALVLILGGGIVLAGWWFDIPALKSVSATYSSMKANAALGFVLSGLALWLAQFEVGAEAEAFKRNLVRLICWLVVLLGALTLAEYFFQWDLGIDQLLCREAPGAVDTLSPGRMAANSAVCFCLVGLAILCLDLEDKNGRRPAQYLIMAVGFIVLLSLVGYLFHVEAFYDLSKYSKMALHTVALFAVSFFAVLFARPDRGLMALVTSESGAGESLRRLLTVGCFGLLLLALLSELGVWLDYYDEAFRSSLFVVGAIIYVLVLLWLNATQLYRRDVEHLQLDAALVAARDEAQSSSHLKELLLDILRHDLMSPAGVIKSSAAIVMMKEPDEAARKEFLRLIVTSADHIIDLIENAKIYARLENAESLPRERADLNEVLHQVADELNVVLLEHKIRLELLPQGERPALVNQMVRDVFANLLSNAIKYSPDGARVEVNILGTERSWLIYVKDWGVGIADADKPTLFTRFKRVEKQGVKGTGLGLAIVKRIVELHAGRVWIENNPEGGSIFYVEIPKE
ncbi:MAG: HAMP domain-containing histidine kinase [Candidatus Saganbacteria bacterium]|nr:HAMP domain-containing histidine kinase [Candidatus Saganbacteria bacterium]